MSSRVVLTTWRANTYTYLKPLIHCRKSSIRKLQKRIQGSVRGLNLRGRTVHTWTFIDVSTLVVGALMNPCPYCQEPIQWNYWSLDHKKPVERGGSNGPGNVHVVCRRCNRAKGTVSHRAFQDILQYMRRYPKAYNELLARLSYGGAFHSHKRTI